MSLYDYMKGEARFRMVQKRDPDHFRALMAAAEHEVDQRYAVYERLAGLVLPASGPGNAEQDKSSETEAH